MGIDREPQRLEKLFQAHLSRRRLLHLGTLGAVSVVATKFLAACGGEKAAVLQTPPPTETLAPTPVPAPTPEATPTPTPAPTPEPTPSPTPTPERPQFTFQPYGVYVGDSDIGGKVLIATLPNGQLIFHSEVTEPKCSIPVYFKHVFTASSSYQPDNFNLVGRTLAKNQVTGRLVDATTISGEVSSEKTNFTSPSGEGVCEAGHFSFTAKLIGAGKDVLLEAYKNILIPPRGFPPETTKEQVQAALETFCGCKLPEK